LGSLTTSLLLSEEPAAASQRAPSSG